jgi:uncharacterized membrane protein
MTRGERLAVAMLVVCFAGAYALYGLVRHRQFGSGAYDLGIFDQAVWHLSRFEAPASSISGFSNVLGDHFSPIIVLFAPLYWLVAAPETLIVAQASLFAVSIIPVFVFLRDRLPRGSAIALSAAYALFWGLQRAIEFDVHEVAFAPAFIATAILAMDRRQWPLFWAALVLIVLVKEDLIPLVTCFGLLLIVTGERRRGAGLVAASLATFVVVVTLVIPSFSDSGVYNTASAYRDIMQRPWAAPVRLVTPPVKIETAFMWVAPFVFLSLRSPLAILLVPFVLERFLSASPNHWGTTFHYSAPLAPIIAMSAGDGLARLSRRVRSHAIRVRLTFGLAAASVVLSSILPGHLPLWRLLAPRFYQQTVFHRTGHEILALLPEGRSVVAQAAVAPHLSQRDHVYVLDPRAPDADFVVASAQLNPWPARSFDELARLLDDRRRHGYVAIFEEHGWILLRRGPGP